MRRRTFLGLAAGLGAAAVTGACGVPSSSDPIRLANAPTPAPPELDVRMPFTAQDAKLPDLVKYFLNAAAGGNTTLGNERPEAPNQARQRMKDFLTETGQRQWQPSLKVLVVRADINPPVPKGLEWTVDVSCVPLGHLEDNGDVSPSQIDPFRLVLTVVSVSPGLNQYRIDSIEGPANAPVDLLLADTALSIWYDPFPTYFWDTDSDTLVPELRYMPRVIASANRPAETVRWLTDGPSGWFVNVLKRLPQEIELKDTASWDGGNLHLTLNLTSKFANLDRDAQRKFAIQVWWTMREYTGTVELTVEGAAIPLVIDGSQALGANRAVHTDSGVPEKFCIVDGKVRETDGLSMPLLAPVGTPSPNTGVSLAALTRDGRRGALVRVDGKQLRLWVGSVKSANETDQATYVQTEMVGKRFSRPVWISRPTWQVMIVVDGVLKTLNPLQPGDQGTVVTLPRGLTGPVTAVSVAQDGRRIALIVGGQVIVATLIFSDSDAIGIDTYRTVSTPLAAPNAVGWGDVVSLVVGGEAAPPQPNGDTPAPLLTVLLSSAVLRPESVESFIIDQVSTYPSNANPAVGNQSPFIMVEANQRAFNVYSTLTPIPGPAPSPAPSAGATPPPPSAVSSPFFLD